MSDKMHATRKKAPLLWPVVAFVSAFGVFVVDTLTTFEFAIAVLYVVVVLLSATYLDRFHVLVTALGCACLTLLSLVLVHGLSLPNMATWRAVMSLAAIGITTVLALQNMSANQRLIAVQRQRANLARFFAPQVVDELAEQDAPLSITRQHSAAILFVDMIGFTAFCARLSPDEAIAFLRDLHLLLSESVFSNQGIVDKLLGDGLLAVFGPPLPGPADATNAVRCGIDILHSIATWNGQRHQSSDQVIKVAIGVHYGPVVQGNIGGANRVELTVVGDTVNVASRVEAYTRATDFDMLVTTAVLHALHTEGSDHLIQMFTNVGKHVLRGRVEPTHLYGIRMPSLETSVQPLDKTVEQRARTTASRFPPEPAKRDEAILGGNRSVPGI
jgi:class 3 adenylate cyclase